MPARGRRRDLPRMPIEQQSVHLGRGHRRIPLPGSAVADRPVGYHAAGGLGADPGPPPDPVRGPPDHGAGRPHPRAGPRAGPTGGTRRPRPPARRVGTVHQRRGPARRGARRDLAGDAARADRLRTPATDARVPPMADAAHHRVPRLHPALRARPDLRVGRAVGRGTSAGGRRLAVHPGTAGGDHVPGGRPAQARGRAAVGPAARPAGTGQRGPGPVRPVRLLRARGAGDLPAARGRAADVPAGGPDRARRAGDPGRPGVPGPGDRPEPPGDDHGHVRRPGGDMMRYDWRDRILVVGTGPAGMAAADELRRLGFTGQLTVLGDEAPYDRPACSKGVLSGHQKLSDVRLPAPEAPMDLRLGRRAVGLDTRERVVFTDDGAEFEYDGLVIATGAAPVVPDGWPIGEPGLHTLHTLEDAWAIRQELYRAEKVAIVGGGLTGCEAACAARSLARRAAIIDIKHPLFYPPPLQGLGTRATEA